MCLDQNVRRVLLDSLEYLFGFSGFGAGFYLVVESNIACLRGISGADTVDASVARTTSVQIAMSTGHYVTDISFRS